MSDDDELEKESEIHRLVYEKGDKTALWLMIRHCFVVNWPVPEWATKAFIDACSYVEMGGTRSWDDVFGDPHPGRHIWSVALENRNMAFTSECSGSMGAAPRSTTRCSSASGRCSVG